MRDLVYDTLSRYLRYVKVSGPNNVGGPCPFHKGGMEKRPSFYMNVRNGLFYCHSCHISGGFATFLRLVGMRRQQIDSILKNVKFESPAEAERKRFREDVSRTPHRLNEALLGVFQYCPTDLIKSGFDRNLLEDMEIGFDRDQMRITFPIRDLHGDLAGISGRTVIDSYPRYKVYKSDDILPYASDDPEVVARYMRYEIKSHNYLWNMHRLYPKLFFGDGLDTLVIVEGYKACLWLIQNGVDNTVAIQGSRMSWAQERILSRFDCTFILFLDNNDAGKIGTSDMGNRLARHGARVLCCVYPDDCDENTQPDDLDKETIYDVLDHATTLRQWRLECRIPPPKDHRSARV